MDLRWECARRTAALLRAECAEVLAAEGAAQRAAAYRILRAAQNLEMWAQLTGTGLPPRVMDLSASARALVEAAREDGLALTFSAGYVSYEEQQRLFEEKVQQLQNEEGLTTVMARTQARLEVPMAGESDMQSGMCLRVEADPETFGDSRTCSWLRNHMGKYGFVFRYPADKEDYTGCTEDLTVIRYVGSGHATSMQQLSMCLEEYISYLSRQG